MPTVGDQDELELILVMFLVTSSQHRRCFIPTILYTTSCEHSRVLLRMGEIIVRNMLS